MTRKQKKGQPKVKADFKGEGKETNWALPLLREISNVWGFNKDGKVYLKKPSGKDLRK